MTFHKMKFHLEAQKLHLKPDALIKLNYPVNNKGGLSIKKEHITRILPHPINKKPNKHIQV